MSCLRPLLWPYPFIPLVNRTAKDFMGSPVPILASHLEQDGGTFALKWQACTDSNFIHINIDDSEAVGPMLDVYLAQLFSHTKLLDTLTEIQVKFKDAIKQQKAPQSQGGPSMTFLQSMQAVHIIRFTMAEIFTDGLNLDIMRDTDDIDLLKADIIKKSKLQDKKHKKLLDSQLFSYFVERQITHY